MSENPNKNLEEAIISLIFSLGRLVREHTDEEKAESPSFIQLEMMKRIDDTQGLTMKDMAQFLCIKAPSVTYLMEDLVEKKYTKRTHDAKDRRVVKIVLTPKGKKTLGMLYPHRAGSLRKVLDQLAVTDRKTFLNILEKMHKIYKQKSNINKI
jgi:DNA-binding MarR family transcriptional regulator